MEHHWYIHFLEQYVRDRYSREDHLRFLEWFDRLPAPEKEQVLEVYHRLSSSRDQPQNEELTELLFLGIEKRLDLLDRDRPAHRRFVAWTRKAAWTRKYAAIGLLAVLLPAAGYLSYKTFFSGTEIKASRTLSEADVLPAGNKAVLTLSDGSKIILDEAGRGKLAEQQGVFITKNAEGKLRYVPGKKGSGPGPGEALSNIITTPRGGFYQVILPDGSTIWLNSASSVRYPAAFSGGKREIELLYGEIYIDVVPSTQPGENPFIVLSRTQRIEVYGTEFNVQSYEDEEAVTTTLIHGSIKLSLRQESNSRAGKDLAESVLLQPGQSAIVARDAGKRSAGIRVEPADTEKIAAWKNGYFRFRNTPLREIMRELSRWYDIEVQYNGDFKNDRYTGYISRHVTLSNVLKIFGESGGLSFLLHDKILEVSPGVNRWEPAYIDQ